MTRPSRANRANRHGCPVGLGAALLAALGAACTGVLSGPGGGDGDGPPVIIPGEPCEDERPATRQLRLLTRREYQNTVRDLLGVEVDPASIPVEPRVKGFDNNAAAMVITSRHMDAFLALAEGAVERAITDRRGDILRCDPGAAGCARQFVEEIGLRAMRRPLAADEIDLYASAFEGETFDDGMRIALATMMVSPSFLYRWEVGEVEGGVARLTAYETASALSYLFWGTMPDQELFDAARAGRLATPEQITSQARRLLADPRAREQVAEFARQWLRTDGITSNKDMMIYPSFTDEVRAAMIEEERRFINDVVFDRNGSFADLFVADHVLVNGPLASFYGLSGPGGGEFAEVAVDRASGRGGVLGLGSVLASHAHSNESSPIKRGVFVRGRLLCQDLPPPPPDVDATPPGLDPTLTTRERFARHTEDPVCASCHQYIDGVGFGFEGFDGVGARRTVENGLPVDMSGAIVGLEGLDLDTEQSFEDVPELAELIAGSEGAQACFPLQYFRYARGYEESIDDSCAVHNLHLAFSDADLSVQEMLVAIVGLPTFTTRKAEEAP
jgi:Protein of unknown function (DUF1592)/Protein of unknown function (DUF1588)/Protein of unknown function (DUF1587)/Protein of unknown function (DUF1595)/Protein of unknown function (DUF1585)